MDQRIDPSRVRRKQNGASWKVDFMSREEEETDVKAISMW